MEPFPALNIKLYFITSKVSVEHASIFVIAKDR